MTCPKRRRLFWTGKRGLSCGMLAAALIFAVSSGAGAQTTEAWSPAAKRAVQALATGLAPFGDMGDRVRRLIEKTPDHYAATGTYSVTDGGVTLVALRNAPAYNAALVLGGRLPIGRKDGMWARATGIELRNAIFFYGHRGLNRRSLSLDAMPDAMRKIAGRLYDKAMPVTRGVQLSGEMDPHGARKSIIGQVAL